MPYLPLAAATQPVSNAALGVTAQATGRMHPAACSEEACSRMTRCCTQAWAVLPAVLSCRANEMNNCVRNTRPAVAWGSQEEGPSKTSAKALKRQKQRENQAAALSPGPSSPAAAAAAPTKPAADAAASASASSTATRSSPRQLPQRTPPGGESRSEKVGGTTASPSRQSAPPASSSPAAGAVPQDLTAEHLRRSAPADGSGPSPQPGGAPADDAAGVQPPAFGRQPSDETPSREDEHAGNPSDERTPADGPEWESSAEGAGAGASSSSNGSAKRIGAAWKTPAPASVINPRASVSRSGSPQQQATVAAAGDCGRRSSLSKLKKKAAAAARNPRNLKGADLAAHLTQLDMGKKDSQDVPSGGWLKKWF